MEKSEEAVRRPVPDLFRFGRLDHLQSGLLHLEICFNIDMRRRRTLVAKPEGNQRDINARLQKMHRSRVPEGMRRDIAFAEARAVAGGSAYCTA